MNNFTALKYGRRLVVLPGLLLLLQLAACQTPSSGMDLPTPLRPPQQEVSDAGITAPAVTETVAIPETGFSETPQVPAGPTVAGLAYEPEAQALQGEPVQVSAENLPLPAFINEVFGELLGLSFEIAPDLERKQDLVTLRVVEPVPPADLYRLAVKVLADYGVEVQQQAGFLRFARGRGTPAGEPPLLVSGRSLPAVPVTHRPLFQFVPLHNVKPGKVKNWLGQIYKGQVLLVSEDPISNSIILQGSQAVVGLALEAIALLDQPSMRGRYSLRIEPVYQSPADLSEALVTVLQSEGYDATSKPPLGSVLVLPMDNINAVLVFAADRKLREHVRQWAGTLDQPSRAGSSGGLFYYPVRNTRADELAETLNKLGAETAKAAKQGSKAGAGSKTATARGQKLVVDEVRNAILFHGQAEEWSRLLPIIHKMDVPPKQVLIEVTVAEVTLNEDDHFGVEWLANGSVDDYSTIFGTLGGLGVGSPVTEGGLSGGFTYTLSAAGQTRLVLNALAADQRINVLSTPRIMVKGGTDASIEIGTEVPVVTQQATATDIDTGETTSPSVLQNIQYRKTGVLLNVKPIIHAGRRVDLDISQEISGAEINQTSGVDSPTITTRRVESSLSLQDGGSVLIGGLIANNGSANKRGIPGLRDIPVLGSLFSTNATSQTRTELLILIVPYIIDDAEEAEAITRSFKERLSLQADEQPGAETGGSGVSQ